MQQPLISVIIPVFNTEKYLKECLDSVLKQTYANIEILLVDDGSSDGCPAICDEYGLRDERVKVFHKENGGQASARNLGIKQAKGFYLAFVDSDDVVSPFFLERLYVASSKFCADVVFTKIKVFVGEAEIPHFESGGDCLVEKNKVIERFSSPKISDSIPIISFCNKLFKRTLLQNFQFPEGIAYEDTASIFLPLYKMNACAFVDSNLYFYRKNENSTTNHQFNEKCLDAVTAFGKAIDFFSEKKENVVAQRLLLPLMMHEIFCWWGFSYVMKDKKKGQEMLDLYRETGKKIVGNAIPFKWKVILSVIGTFPTVYRIYRRVSVVRIGDR